MEARLRNGCGPSKAVAASGRAVQWTAAVRPLTLVMGPPCRLTNGWSEQCELDARCPGEERPQFLRGRDLEIWSPCPPVPS